METNQVQAGPGGGLPSAGRRGALRIGVRRPHFVLELTVMALLAIHGVKIRAQARPGAVAIPAASTSRVGGEISYSRQVRPILAEHCFACHGPDEAQRKAGLRLDDEPTAKSRRKGRIAIVSGDPQASELIRRIHTQDPDDVMPPPQQVKRLSSAEQAILDAWIRQGAKWGKHWAFEKPVRPVVPDASIHPIDSLVRARLQRQGLTPSPEADRRTLARRLYLDLVGLPPSPGEMAAFVADRTAEAYERLVDRLLMSPHFGERWGRHWLDLARYADSDGYEKDSPRPTAYYFRDWVIRAINEDLPFDQFTIEQLAGDLLPGATESQRIATGFHRQTLTNKEGGVDPEEFRCKATVDRTHTTAAVWLGLTLGCAECHSHKFDPISQREFYQFYAFFNNASESNLPQPTPRDREVYAAARAAWVQRVATLEARFAAIPETARGEGEKLKQELEKLKQSEPKFEPPAALVLASEARETRIHVRGDFLQKGDRVEPAPIAALHPFHPRGEVADRLDLARWLVSSDNPLIARVTVNHFWRQLFGRALVATENDFGLRGGAPSHPELLDWLATEFVRLGWSRKRMIRSMVLSHTYRQSSDLRQELAEQDPWNIGLARQGRFRVEAEVVRDIALAASGLLNSRVGGPSFKPPLPADLAALSYASGLKWEPSSVAERHRRGLYLHFQRTVPFPMLTAFDAPESNQTCTRRERSSTPMQALTLLNNELFTECARALGQRLLTHSKEPAEQIRHGFACVTGRLPRPPELARLLQFHSGQRALFERHPAAASQLLGAAWPGSSGMSPASVQDAATAVALGRILLNLDETITRE